LGHIVNIVPSAALVEWQTNRAAHLDELIHAHRLVEVRGPGRRWRTESINAALMLRLAAEFQGFSRELHDLACDRFAAWSAPTNAALQDVIRNRLREARAIDKGNAQPSALAKDFGRFGFRVWPTLELRTSRAGTFNASLDRLNTARNGIAHAQDEKLAQLRDEGYPITLPTFRKWRGHLAGLAAILDLEVSTQLGALFGQSPPW
jgi:hypothetical protein